MSDQKPDAQPATNAPAEAPAPAPAKTEIAGKLEARPMTVLDQVFIWTMVLLVGVIFGVGPSFGMAMGGRAMVGDIDSGEIRRRERIAVTLQEILNPQGSPYTGPVFASRLIQSPYGPYPVRKDVDTYAEEIRKARYAADLGLMPSKAEADVLVDDFLKRKIGNRTYAQKIADDRKAKEITEADLKLLLTEQFALQALAARTTSAPAMPLAASATVKTWVDEKVSTDLVMLTAKPILPEVKADDPEIQSAYETLANRDRFALPAAMIVQVAAPDFAALLKAQNPTEEQAKAWYESHKADYQKPVPPQPDNGQTPAKTEPEYLSFAEVQAQILETLRRNGASAAAQAQVEAFAATIEESGLEQSDAAHFTRAATAAGLQVQEDVAVPEVNDGAVTLPGFGKLKRNAREIGLISTKIGSVTDQQQTEDGRWVLMRIAGRKEASRKTLDDEEVRKQVIAYLAGRRSYPLLLKEAEALRAEAEKAGPGGLRKLFTSEAVKAKWNVEVITNEMNPQVEIEAPTPADDGATRADARTYASIAVKGNPVVLGDGDPEADVPTVKLIQVTGLVPAKEATAEERTRYAGGLRDMISGILANQAEAAVRRKL